MGSILGGILGGGSSPGQAQQEAALRNATEAYRQYRPEAMQARLNAMGTISNAYQGANNALETLWGAPPSGGPSQSPMARLSMGGLSAAKLPPTIAPGPANPAGPGRPVSSSLPSVGLPIGPDAVVDGYSSFIGNMMNKVRGR